MQAADSGAGASPTGNQLEAPRKYRHAEHTTFERAAVRHRTRPGTTLHRECRQDRFTARLGRPNAREAGDTPYMDDSRAPVRLGNPLTRSATPSASRTGRRAGRLDRFRPLARDGDEFVAR